VSFGLRQREGLMETATLRFKALKRSEDAP